MVSVNKILLFIVVSVKKNNSFTLVCVNDSRTYSLRILFILVNVSKIFLFIFVTMNKKYLFTLVSVNDFRTIPNTWNKIFLFAISKWHAMAMVVAPSVAAVVGQLLLVNWSFGVPEVFWKRKELRN